jgi:sirohydrochlorin ferrochelatase
MSLGIVILGHGSRAAVGEANNVVFQVADLVRLQRVDDMVETAIMNRDSGLQTIEAAVESLIIRGAKKVIIAPLFFANGMHIRSDIPAEISALQAKHPEVIITMASPIGADKRLADILVERIEAVL